MKTFKINENLEIVCERKKTRNGFKHEATLLKDGNEIGSAKINYLNRTWEKFEFQSVLEKLLEKAGILTEKEKEGFLRRAEGRDREKTDSKFKMISGIAKMGEIFGKTKKDKNDWKARMLRAGLGNSGLSMPEDWDQLTEDEKERRLNGVIGELNKQ